MYINTLNKSLTASRRCMKRLNNFFFNQTVNIDGVRIISMFVFTKLLLINPKQR